MANYQSKNNRTIERAFKRFRQRTEQEMTAGMTALLDDAVTFALNNHDAAHPYHLEMGDSYAWALVHDGKVIARKVIRGDFSILNNFVDKFHEAVTEGVMPSGQAHSQIMRLASEAQGGGYIGIVMAGMVNAPTYFSVRFETAVLNDTMSDIRAKFQKYFKRIEK